MYARQLIFGKKTQKIRAFLALGNRPPNGPPAQSAWQRRQGRGGSGGGARACKPEG